MNGSGDITILAIGGAGCRIMRVLRTLPGAESVRLLALDTDRTSLEATGLPESDRMLAGEVWRGGRGCGGSELDGQRAVAHERSRLEEMLRGSRFLVVLCGLGGGTASGGAPVVLSVAARLKLPNLFLVTLPFVLEGPKRRNLAERVLSESLFDVADAVVTLPDDLLFSTLPGDVPLAAAFETADRECAGTALALSTVLAAGNLLNADMASLTSLLKRRKSLCSIGVGIVRSGGDCPPDELPEKLVAGMLASPLLGGPRVLKEADAAVISLLGGSDLSLGDVRNTLELVAKYLPADAEQLTAASSHPDWQGARQLCVLTVKYSEPLPAMSPRAAARPRREPRAADKPAAAPQGGTWVQQEFMLDPISKGIMERTTPVLWNNEDLDEPTYKRRNMVVDDGGKGSGTRR